MIVGEQKPISEIKEIIAPYKKILILGCGTCVKTCFAGGEDEVAVLASALRLACKKDGKEIEIEEFTVERQCEDEFIMRAYYPWPAAPVFRHLPDGSLKFRFCRGLIPPSSVFWKGRAYLPRSVPDAVIVCSPYLGESAR